MNISIIVLTQYKIQTLIFSSKNMNPLQETFLLYFLPGILISFLLVYSSGNLRWFYRYALLLLSILINWLAIFLGVHMGYGAWQNMPNPPDEAFADGAHLTMAFIGGWIPGIILFFAMYILVLLIKKIQKRAFTQSQ